MPAMREKAWCTVVERQRPGASAQRSQDPGIACHVRELSGCGGRCVSVFLPAHRVTPDSGKEPIRLRNMLDEAARRLAAQGVRRRRPATPRPPVPAGPAPSRPGPGQYLLRHTQRTHLRPAGRLPRLHRGPAQITGYQRTYRPATSFRPRRRHQLAGDLRDRGWPSGRLVLACYSLPVPWARSS